MRTISRVVVVASLLVLMTGVAAFAERSPNATLLYALEIGPDGAARAVNLECAAAGEGFGKVLRNGGQQAAKLFFSDGSELVLEPGQEVELSAVAASTHKCACQCTCSGTGFSEKMTFDCPAGGCAGENGSACFVFIGTGTELKEGTLSGCRKVYIPVLSEPAEPAAEESEP